MLWPSFRRALAAGVVRFLTRSFLLENQYDSLAPSPPGPPPPSTGTRSTFTNPFSDSHAVSALSDIDVSNVDQVEMSRFESEPTGGQFIICRCVGDETDITPEAAFIMDLQDRDGTTREFVATFPLEAISGHRAHQGGEMPPHDNLVSD